MLPAGNRLRYSTLILTGSGGRVGSRVFISPDGRVVIATGASVAVGGGPLAGAV